MSEYRTAIDQTITVINQRSRTFLNQVMVVVAIASGSAAGGVVLHKLWPLTGLLVIVPACGLFLWLDTRRLVEWRLAILQMWARRDIDLMAFRQAMRANPMLPEITLNGMLGLLGTPQIGDVEIHASAQTRYAVAAVAGFADVLSLRQFALKVVAYAIVAAGACGSAATHSGMPLFFATVPVLALWLLGRRRGALQRQSRATLKAARQHPAFDADAFRRLFDHLQLGCGRASTAGWIDPEPADRRTGAQGG
ncbi:MAG: hypothetical protein ABIW85_07280 [Variovorax sp.]